MATLTELVDSREITLRDGREVRTMHYTLEGTSDADAALALVKSATSSWHNQLKRGDIRVAPEYVDTVADDGRWEVEVDYVEEEEAPPEPGDESFSFDTGGGTTHMTQSLETIARHAPTGKTPPDFKGAIGYNGEEVLGVDITTPIYYWSETHTFADSAVTNAYRGKLFRLTGKTNAAIFKGLAIGECLFLGASGSKRGDGNWQIAFRFAGSPNATDITIGDITVAAKKGWEYLWIRYQDTADDAAKAMVKRPVAAIVERVYPAGDYSDLNIGA